MREFVAVLGLVGSVITLLTLPDTSITIENDKLQDLVLWGPDAFVSSTDDVVTFYIGQLSAYLLMSVCFLFVIPPACRRAFGSAAPFDSISVDANVRFLTPDGAIALVERNQMFVSRVPSLSAYFMRVTPSPGTNGYVCPDGVSCAIVRPPGHKKEGKDGKEAIDIKRIGSPGDGWELIHEFKPLPHFKLPFASLLVKLSKRISSKYVVNRRVTIVYYDEFIGDECSFEMKGGKYSHNEISLSLRFNGAAPVGLEGWLIQDISVDEIEPSPDTSLRELVYKWKIDYLRDKRLRITWQNPMPKADRKTAKEWLKQNPNFAADHNLGPLPEAR